VNARECFRRIMSYRPAERLPLMVIDPYESLTADRWRNEGLPEGESVEGFLKLDRPPEFWVHFGPVGHTCLAGGRDAIRREIDRLLPLIHEGGFIPAVDDMVPPEIPFENYRYCIERLRAIRGVSGYTGS